MNPICIFFHGLFFIGNDLLPSSLEIIAEQMQALKETGLEQEATEIHIGINGGEESRFFAESLFPERSILTYHGLQCRNECRTIRLIEEWVMGHQDWYVLYFHAKGCTHPAGDPMRTSWRQCFMRHLIFDWRKCVAGLGSGYDAVSCHWMKPPQTPPTQYIFAGNMWWAKASFLSTLPSIMARARIKESGLDSLESRYESEVILGNGPRLPVIKDFCPNWHPGKPHPV